MSSSRDELQKELNEWFVSSHQPSEDFSHLYRLFEFGALDKLIDVKFVESKRGADTKLKTANEIKQLVEDLKVVQDQPSHSEEGRFILCRSFIIKAVKNLGLGSEFDSNAEFIGKTLFAENQFRKFKELAADFSPKEREACITRFMRYSLVSDIEANHQRIFGEIKATRPSVNQQQEQAKRLAEQQQEARRLAAQQAQRQVEQKAQAEQKVQEEQKRQAQLLVDQQAEAERRAQLQALAEQQAQEAKQQVNQEQKSKAVLTDEEKVNSIAWQTLNKIFQSQHKNVKASQASQVILPTNTTRKIYSKADAEIQLPLILAELEKRQAILDAKSGSCEIIKKGEVAVTFVEIKNSQSLPSTTRVQGCFAETVNESNKYSIKVVKLPSSIDRVAIFEDILKAKGYDPRAIPATKWNSIQFVDGIIDNPDIRKVEQILQEHKFVPKPPDTVESIATTLASLLAEKFYHGFFANNLPEHVKKMPCLDYLTFANGMCNSFLSECGTNKKIYIRPNADTLLVKSLILICEQRKLKYENVSGVDYHPQKEELDVVKGYFHTGDLSKTIEVSSKQLMEQEKLLAELEDKVHDKEKILKIREYIGKIASGVQLSDSESAEIANLAKEVEVKAKPQAH